MTLLIELWRFTPLENPTVYERGNYEENSFIVVLRQSIAFLMEFTRKQAYACLFGAVLLAVIFLTRYFTIPFISRYDFIFIFAIATQFALIALKLETKREVLMVAVFHVLATMMELFKTSPGVGSWVYPQVGEAVFHIRTVPLFSGFLYSAVGSYLARVWRMFRFRFSPYPPFWMTMVFAAMAYANFFTHHFLPDIRISLFIIAVLLYGRSFVYFTIAARERRMPLLLGFFLVALFIWIAENIGTFSSVWLYPFQAHGWSLVPFHKLGAWFLLMMVSFILITTIHKRSLYEQ